MKRRRNPRPTNIYSFRSSIQYIHLLVIAHTFLERIISTKKEQFSAKWIFKKLSLNADGNEIKVVESAISSVNDMILGINDRKKLRNSRHLVNRSREEKPADRYATLILH
ncbi:hypothetical protein BpHYR1_046992 [Brachionus plicatilis]|uniref:Uncharacterized protein n=1 Tax=Brachionus plicatilis TaxID=10195 RepID=A0A3M7SDQ7_BRAPC|nr:hypothetical protein BpHYR1_046992 [Brachionus plicatilis]